MTANSNPSGRPIKLRAKPRIDSIEVEVWENGKWVRAQEARDWETLWPELCYRINDFEEAESEELRRARPFFGAMGL